MPKDTKILNMDHGKRKIKIKQLLLTVSIIIKIKNMEEKRKEIMIMK